MLDNIRTPQSSPDHPMKVWALYCGQLMVHEIIAENLVRSNGLPMSLLIDIIKWRDIANWVLNQIAKLKEPSDGVCKNMQIYFSPKMQVMLLAKAKRQKRDYL